MGGSSKSSSASTTQNQQTTQSASGLVDSVVLNASGGSAVYYTDQFSPEVKSVMEQLINLVEDAGSAAMQGFNKSLEAVTQAAQQASQPDLEIVKTQSSYTPFIIIAALATIAIVLGK